MSKKIIVANWKMNPTSLSKAKEIYAEVGKFIKKTGNLVVVCPPFPFIGSLSGKKSNLSLGAQNVFDQKEGAFTGEVSASQLASLGVSYVVLGHSERRKMGETSEQVSKKISIVLKENLKPIVCIGEKERDADGLFFTVLKQEILETLSSVSKNQIGKVVVAYEPVWAISTTSKGAVAMEPALIHETVLFIKKVLADKYGKEASKVKILYGGSVDQNAARAVLVEGTTDGLLVGKASLKPEIFGKILLASNI